MERRNSDITLLKLIENSNLKDWSCIRRINGQIRLKEKNDLIVENGNEKQTLPSKSRKIFRNCEESVAKKQIEPEN